eukprot:PhM_4_TR6093/c0_g1_i1/m.22472
MDITPTIVQEIVSQCKKQGFIASAALATFVLKTQLLSVQKDAQNNADLTPAQIENLVSATGRILCQNDVPTLETLKMQASLTTLQQEQVNNSRTQKVQHRAKSQHLLDEICRKRDPAECFGDCTLYVLHESHLFHSSQEAVQKETIAALESAFPRSLVESFIQQSDTEKVKQLEELWRIAFGIRLFNKDTHKGGAGIPDAIEEIRKGLASARNTLAQHVAMAEQVCADYRAVLLCPSIQMKDGQRNRINDEYINRLQYLHYARTLSTSVVGVETRFQQLLPLWSKQLAEVRNMVLGADNATVPKSVIYPKFIGLSERWDSVLQVRSDTLDVSAQVELLVAYHKSYTPTLRASDVEMTKESVAPDRPVDRAALTQELTNDTLQYLTALPMEQKSSTSPVKPEFNGFCVCSLIDDGVLQEGKMNPEEPTCPGFLLLHASAGYYAFSNERSLRAFAADPFKYLSQRLMDEITRNVPLIHLLSLQLYLPRELWLAGTRQADAARAVSMEENGTQTGHMDPYKDRKYEWNEWELRRLALKLASLRGKRTHVTQTAASHYRRDNMTQTYPPKEQGTQTLVDAATQPSKMVRYIGNLRGNCDLQPLKITTMVVDE